MLYQLPVPDAMDGAKSARVRENNRRRPATAKGQARARMNVKSAQRRSGSLPASNTAEKAGKNRSENWFRSRQTRMFAPLSVATWVRRHKLLMSCPFGTSPYIPHGHDISNTYTRRMHGIFGEREQAHNDCICTSHPSSA